MRSTAVRTLTLAIAAAGVLLAPERMSAQATGTVTGTVTGANGQPLSGAAVVVDGTGRGEQTGSDGRFTITGVPAGSRTIRANFVSYAEGTRLVTVTAGQTVTANFQLTQTAVMLEGLVAVGYGTTRRQDVTGSVATVQMENLERTTLTSVDQALTGQVPGVNVTMQTGVPGGGPSINVRGAGTIGAAGVPLYVIDGFPIEASSGGQLDQIRSPLADIPVEDIESINVLKDASATAIYGSRGSNGVVIITTKRGRAGEAAQINISASTGRQTLGPQGGPNLMSTAEFAQAYREMYRDAQYLSRRRANPNADPATWEATPAEIDALLPAGFRPYIHSDTLAAYNGFRGMDTNFFDLYLRPANTHNAQVSVSGGSERVRAFVSGGYMLQEGIQINTGFERASARANVDASVSDRLNFAMSLAPTFSKRVLVSTNVGNINQYPFAFARDEGTGRLRRITTADPILLGPQAISGNGFQRTNPLHALDMQDYAELQLTTIGSLSASLSLLDWLTVRSAMNATRSDRRRNVYEPPVEQTDGDFSDPEASAIANSSWSWSNENTVTVLPVELGVANTTFDALAGFTMERERSDGYTLTGENFPDTLVTFIDAATERTFDASTSRSAMASWLARTNLNIDERFVLTGTLRGDGSARFGPENRWGVFPSGAFAWNIGNEAFMQNVNWLQDLKLRASYGISGNNQIGNFQYLGLVGISDINYSFNEVVAGGRRLNNMGNSALGWEKLREINLGVDAELFDGRLALTVDGYRRTTTDLLLNFELPGSAGFNSVRMNMGSIRNQGLEFSLTSYNLELDNFSWNSNFNVSVNRNKVLSLGPDRDFLTSGSIEGQPSHISRVGHPLAQFWGFKSCGIFSFADDQNGDGFITFEGDGLAATSGATPGSMRFCDIDGNNLIERQSDFDIIGDPHPDAVLSLTNNVTAGPFNVRMLVTGAIGQDRIQAFKVGGYNLTGAWNASRDMFDRWRPGLNADGTPCLQATACASEDPNAPIPVAHRDELGDAMVLFRTSNERMVRNADYAWVRNINVNYNLPGMLLRGGLERGSVYLSIDNPLIITKYDGNPDTGPTGGNASLTPGVDGSLGNTNYPISRTLTLGVNFGL